jgi:branched-chain amino acid transport system permease protein
VKFFHLAHAAVIALGAYLTYFGRVTLHLSLPVSVALAIAGAMLTGVCCELAVYRPMRKTGAWPLSYLIVSIGLYIFFQNSLSFFSGDDPKFLYTGEATAGHRIGGGYITTLQIWIMTVASILSAGANLFLHYARWGKAMRAVAANPELCRIYGVNTGGVILLSFVAGSALGAAAGILAALDTGATPSFGFNLLLYGVVVMIIGGVDSTRGFVGGALLLATVQHLSAYLLDTKWMDAVMYLLLILFLVWRPLGFSGARLKKVEV